LKFGSGFHAHPFNKVKMQKVIEKLYMVGLFFLFDALLVLFFLDEKKNQKKSRLSSLRLKWPFIPLRKKNSPDHPGLLPKTFLTERNLLLLKSLLLKQFFAQVLTSRALG
jgi:hypothetical protein